MRKTISILIISLILLTILVGGTSTAASLRRPEKPALLTHSNNQSNDASLQIAQAGQVRTTKNDHSAAAQPSDSVPPFVISALPEQGSEQPLDAPVQISFDQPMKQDTVEKAFAIEPGASVDGHFTWLDDQTVQFRLKDGFQRGQRYRLRIVTSAESQTGLRLQRPFERRFSAIGFLEVGTVQPADGTDEVRVNTPVIIRFNRPVVALGAVEAAGTLPDPLTFTPPVMGDGEWLNTATYRFAPSGDGFKPATEYIARIGRGLTDLTGQALLQDDFEWRFTTISPAVVASLPGPDDRYISPTPVISIAFNQLMDHPSVEQNLQLVDAATEQHIPGQFDWVERGITSSAVRDEIEGPYRDNLPLLEEAETIGQETVTFIPDNPLNPAATYRIVLPAGVKSTLGTETKKGYEVTFTVTPQPEVTSSIPQDGAEFTDIWEGLQISFNAPMKPASVKIGQNLIIEPAEIARTDVYTYWDNNDTVLNVSFPRQENRSYTATLKANIEGRYGQPLGKSTTINWKTLRQSPYVQLVSPKVASYNGYHDETYIYMTVRNVNRVKFDLYHLSFEDFMRLAPDSYRGWTSGYNWADFKPNPDDRIGQWEQATDPEKFVNYVYRVDISQAIAQQDPLPPGLYYLEAFSEPQDFYDEARSDDPDQTRDRQILIISRHNLTLKRGKGDLLAWLTNLQSGQSVSGVPLSFTPPNGQSETASTDDEGIATFSYQPLPNDPNSPLFIVAGDPDQPSDDFAIGSTAWGAGISSYDFDFLFDPRGSQFSRPYFGNAYTERRIYRPGQTVYFKAVIRGDNDASYFIPTGQKFQVMIFDAQYREIYNEELPVNDMGTLNGSLLLDENASLGGYQLQVNSFDAENNSLFVAFNTFNVAEFRKPEFLVEAATDKPEYKAGETINLTVDAEFFFGGPVANAAVRWALLSDTYFFSYKGKGFYDFTNEDNSQANAFNPNYSYGFGEHIASGSGQTGTDGRFTVEVPADLTRRLTSQTFTFDIAVTGLNNQEVATQIQAIVHKGDFYIGLRPASYVGQIGAPNEIEIVLVDPDSQPVAGQPVELVMARENWYSVQQLDVEATRYSPEDQFYWQNIVENVAVFTTTVTTDQQGKATASFTPDQGGAYKIYARSVDTEQRELFSSLFLWVTGYQYVNWSQENNDRIELVADQPEYNTGDTASILVPHPYSGPVQALVTLERGRIYDHFVTELATNSEQIQIPITGEMSPNIYVSVMIIKGMNSSTADSTTTNDSDSISSTATIDDDLPGFKLGYTHLNINPAEKQLNISLTPTTPPTEAGYYEPNQTIEYQIKVTDFQGRPVRAELSLALVDKAILTLAPERPGELLDSFWKRRALETETGAGLTLALDRINRALDKRKGGGGGDGAAGLDAVRQNFADVPLWIPDLLTDENGEATIEATLPDNLTTWVLLAKGITGAETLVGESQTEIATSKPLLVRPVSPRFLVVGDRVQLGLIVQNTGSEPLLVKPGVEAEGLQIEEWRIGGGRWQAIDDTGEFNLAAEEEIKIDYQATALDGELASLMMWAETAAGSAQLSDAVSITLPIQRLSTPETVATLGVMEEDGVRLEGIALPASVDATQGNLTVSIEPSLAAGMKAGLTYLEHYPHESTEQVVSRFLPNLVTFRALREAGFDDPALADRLTELVGAGLQRLNSQQSFDGGWGWWFGETSDPFLTAYVLLSMVEARRSDFPVADWVIENAVNYLKQNLVRPKDIVEPWQANRQAFILYVLAEAGQSDFSRAVTLFEQREQLDMFGRAYLALAMHLADRQASQVDTLLADLTAGAVASATGVHWEERQIDYFAMNTDIRSTAIIIATLSRIQPDHPLLPQAVRWLMTARSQNDHWSTTQETAWAIIGLTDWLTTSGELQANYAWQVSLNTDPLDQGQADKLNLDQTTQIRVAITDLLTNDVNRGVNRLAIERDTATGSGQNEDAGNLYYAAYLTYYKPVEQVKALDRGIIISRQYSLQGDEDQPITEAKVGDFIQVKLTLVAPTDLHYVIVEDALPAGAEALDSSLATTSIVGPESVVGQPPQLGRVDDKQPWGWWYFTHTDLRDEKAVLFATYLPKGVYEYTYTIRASLPGDYRVIPTHAEQLYFPETFGRSDGGLFRISN